MAYEHTNKRGVKYYLHQREVTLRGSGKRQTIYFFSKISTGKDTLEEVPEGYRVREIERTGLPILEKT